MDQITLTTLQSNLLEVIEKVLTTGEAVVVDCDGRHLILAREAVGSLLDRLPKRNAIIGDPDDLVSISVVSEQALSHPQDS